MPQSSWGQGMGRERANGATAGHRFHNPVSHGGETRGADSGRGFPAERCFSFHFQPGEAWAEPSQLTACKASFEAPPMKRGDPGSPGSIGRR